MEHPIPLPEREALQTLHKLLGNVSELAEDAHSAWGPDLYDAQEIRELFPQELLLSCTNALHLLEQHHYSVSPTTLSID